MRCGSGAHVPVHAVHGLDSPPLLSRGGCVPPQVLYRGQMVRTWRMLLKCAQDEGYVVGAPHQPANLESESPTYFHRAALSLARTHACK